MTPNITNDAIENVASREVIFQAWDNMVNGVKNVAGTSARARMARRSWFGKTMESSPELLSKFNLLLNFVNSEKPITIAFEKDVNIPSAIAYSFRSQINTPFSIPKIYLTKIFSTGSPNSRVGYVMKNRNILGVQIVALAHELSHIVIGTNINDPGFLIEKYNQEAMHLRDSNPMYALNNADNYGFCIEMCS